MDNDEYNQDIVNRLCDAAFHAHPSSQIGKACCDGADEIERLRSLIVYWCDVVDDMDGHPSDYHSNVAAAEDELRKAVGR